MTWAQAQEYFKRNINVRDNAGAVTKYGLGMSPANIYITDPENIGTNTVLLEQYPPVEEISQPLKEQPQPVVPQPPIEIQLPPVENDTTSLMAPTSDTTSLMDPASDTIYLVDPAIDTTSLTDLASDVVSIPYHTDYSTYYPEFNNSGISINSGNSNNGRKQKNKLKIKNSPIFIGAQNNNK